MNSLVFQKRLLLFSFLFVPVTLLIVFVIYPSVDILRVSFTNWDGLSSVKGFVGLENYRKIFFESSDVWMSFRNNSIYFIVHLIFIPIQLIVAMMLDSKIRGSQFFKTITFMPYIINGVAVAYMFSFFFSSQNGAFDGILNMLGLGSFIREWLSDIQIVNFTLAGISLWRFCGFGVILFLAGLQSVPKEQKEAAIVDGANAFQSVRFIIIPGLRRVIEIALFLNLRGAMQVFDIPFVVTHGGPGYASSTFLTYTIDTAFKFSSFGQASAMAVVLLLMILGLSWTQIKIYNFKRE